VILLCYRGQLLLEQDTLKREREVVSVWPGVEADVKVAMVQQIDALLGAIQPVLDALDAKVFTTMATFKDVRRNLLTQYRQPYWLAAAHLRADAARTWLTYLLLSLQPLLTDDALQPEAVLACFEGVDPLLASAAAAPTIEESRAGFSEAKERLETCSSLLQEAERAQNQSSSPSP
jgi:hypothetical protein